MKTDTTALEGMKLTKGWWMLVVLLTLTTITFLICAIFVHVGFVLWMLLSTFGWFTAVVKTSREMGAVGYYTDDEKAEMEREKQNQA